ncbi:hypothetical protein GCM10010123_36000 [Pilimelia anulata]|uniref:Lycopene cyclase domain-containing protein n=1 Tax=Pilimelia anulata TaxID=53371 RepID=A0A8J3BEI2_9ACTN|nr:lycopene cyclase domain-containing protein [Pilimelia anulata]GGK02833.1 hypothetical protein GCM10010123_36000 [Pilimelia anulata]
MIGEYTVAAVAAPLLVVAVELTLLRTGLLREGRYWVTVAIALGFQVPVDGWLTRADAPVVLYSDAATSGIRWPWHIPIEDFGFGYALVTAALLAWRWLADRPRRGAAARAAAAAARTDPAGPAATHPEPARTAAAARPEPADPGAAGTGPARTEAAPAGAGGGGDG